MRSHVVVAGLAATASAVVTVTQTEDYTVTYCAPTVTNCPAKYNTWAPIPAKPTGPAGKPPGGWNNWNDVPEPQRTWSQWKAQPTPWVGWNNGQPVGPDGKPWSPAGKPPGGWDNWYDVPEPQRTWSQWNAQPTPWVVWVDGKPVGPAGKPPGGWNDWKDVPEAQRTWSEWKAQPTPWNVWVDGKPVGPDGKPVPVTWVDVMPPKPVAPATNTWVDVVPGKPVAPATNTWVNTPVAPAPTAPCPQYTAASPPDWFKNLPSDVLSSMSAKWTGAPPSDWCYWNYNSVPVKTSTVPAGATWAGAPVSPASTGWNNSPVKGYTGAANNNAGSVAMAGLAGLAAIMLA